MIDQLRTNTTLKELIAGAVIYCLAWEIPLLIFTERKLYHSVGLLVGLIACIVLAMNMAVTIDAAVDMNAKGAKAYLQQKASLRYIVVCALIVAVYLTGIGNPLTFFAGIMGLKIGAYMQPLTHKLAVRISNKRGEGKHE